MAADAQRTRGACAAADSRRTQWLVRQLSSPGRHHGHALRELTAKSRCRYDFVEQTFRIRETLARAANNKLLRAFNQWLVAKPHPVAQALGKWKVRGAQ